MGAEIIKEYATCPFRILIDTAEQQPWTFTGIFSDSKQGYKPLEVPYEFSSLGRHPHSLGDYTIEGYQGRVCVERKAKEDAWGTFLGWGDGIDSSGRRDRFICELENLSKVESPIVIIEATLDDCLDDMPSWGLKSVADNRKIFFRSVISWQQKYRIPFWFLNGRRAAEVTAFRYLEKFWEHDQENIKKTRRVKHGKDRQRLDQASSVGEVEGNN
jgi:hypothetical protein